MGYKGNNLNVTLPRDILKKIEDGARAKDMSKSRYVLRLLEKGLGYSSQHDANAR
jgi:hypothetical protein